MNEDKDVQAVSKLQLGTAPEGSQVPSQPQGATSPEVPRDPSQLNQAVRCLQNWLKERTPVTALLAGIIIGMLTAGALCFGPLVMLYVFGAVALFGFWRTKFENNEPLYMLAVLVILAVPTAPAAIMAGISFATNSLGKEYEQPSAIEVNVFGIKTILSKKGPRTTDTPTSGTGSNETPTPTDTAGPNPVTPQPASAPAGAPQVKQSEEIPPTGQSSEGSNVIVAADHAKLSESERCIAWKMLVDELVTNRSKFGLLQRLIGTLNLRQRNIPEVQDLETLIEVRRGKITYDQAFKVFEVNKATDATRHAAWILAFKKDRPLDADVMLQHIPSSDLYALLYRARIASNTDVAAAVDLLSQAYTIDKKNKDVQDLARPLQNLATVKYNEMLAKGDLLPALSQNNPDDKVLPVPPLY